MKPDKNGIGLEAAKLFEPSKFRGKKIFDVKKGKRVNCSTTRLCNFKKVYPAYTWQDILWEYALEFFGEDGMKPKEENEQYIDCDCSGRDMSFERHIVYPSITQVILFLLQQKNYEQAEKIFIENCILLKTK